MKPNRSLRTRLLQPTTQDVKGRVGITPKAVSRIAPALLVSLALLVEAAFLAPHLSAQTAPNSLPDAPDAPKPITVVRRAPRTTGLCQLRNDGATVVFTGIAQFAAISGLAIASPPAKSRTTVPCPLYLPMIDWYARFLDGPRVKPLTPKEKAWLAVRNISDPFNAITILAQSAITIGSDSHTAYGPGMPGFGRNVGVSYAQDMTGEFIGTFLIPSIAHQDPHYHREPHATIKHRILHTIVQVAWTQGDNGKGMINYANLVGYAIDDEISNLYVPGRATNLPASAARYGIGLAIAPTDNLITEFLPDIASHIHFRVVLVQRIIDQVAKTENSGTP